MGCCYFSEVKKKCHENGFPSFILGLNFSFSWLLMGRSLTAKCPNPWRQSKLMAARDWGGWHRVAANGHGVSFLGD